MLLLVDGDPIVYAAGFAAEKQTYEVVAEDAEGRLHEARFVPIPDPKDVRKSVSAGAQLKEWADGKTVLQKERVPVPESKAHALHLVKQQLTGIVSAVKKKYKVDDVQLQVFLTGPGNFREKIATVRKYKGNRDPAHKPYWYQEIRNYLTGTWGARVVEGHEADDEVSLRARAALRAKEKYVVASIDKDLDQIPGRHYDYKRKQFYTISEEEAERFFWQQVLSGDGTDNIPGCYMVAATTADQILAKLEKEGCTDPQCIWDAILVRYGKSQNVKGCPYADKDGRAVALETARLVYMQREPRELWTPPGEPKQYLEAGFDD